MAGLSSRGVDPSFLKWLTVNESRPYIERWLAAGHERYGRLALNPVPGSAVMRGDYLDAEPPRWLAPDIGSVFVLWSGYMEYGLAQCAWALFVANYAAMARADGEFIAAVTADMNGVVSVDVERDRLGDRMLEFTAWGCVVRTPPDS